METLERHHFLKMEMFACSSVFQVITAMTQHPAFSTLGFTSCLYFLFFFFYDKKWVSARGKKCTWNIFTFFLEFSVCFTLFFPVTPTFIYWVFSLLDFAVKKIPLFISVLCCNICLWCNVSIDYSLKTGVAFHAVFH